MNSDAPHLLIVGGSTRAAAWSAIRAGFQPICADLFADADTRQMASIVKIQNYPFSLPDDVAAVRSDAWMFTGALENHPELLDRIALQTQGRGPLLGSAPGNLKRVRDPFWVRQELFSAGIDALAVLPESRPPAGDGNWLRKPIASGGGRAIRIWNAAAESVPLDEPCYFQQLGSGEPMSGVFWNDDHGCRLLGMTRQLVAWDISGALEPFAYCGSVGPIAIAPLLREKLLRMATVLSNASGLRGLFGIDFLKQDQDVWFVELNPRYTASVEVLERAWGTSFLGMYRPWIPVAGDSSGFHQAADAAKIGQSSDPESAGSSNVRSNAVAKVVIYSTDGIEVSNLQEIIESGRDDPAIELADIPLPGTMIEKGWPICTVLAAAPSAEQSLRLVRCQVERLRKAVRFPFQPPGVLDRSDARR